MLELEVPGERGAFEAVEQRHQPAAPLGVVQVDRVDAELGEVGRPPFRAVAHVRHPGGVDQLHGGIGTPQGGELVDPRVTQPQPLEQVRGVVAHHGDHGAADAVLLEVERQVKVGATSDEQLGERRDVLGKLVARHDPDRSLAPAVAYDPVVVEHRDAIAGEPHIALQTGRSELQGQRKGLDGVLPGVGAGTAMGEADRRAEPRREPLLHGSR